ncbi:MAG TPA: NAD(P)-dependent oxidoreductase [Caulobacteraceae bacterium]|jgi:nucleoside-diphosphate-sugar epimerase
MYESTVTAGPRLSNWTAGRKGGVAITGATGWIGAALADFALRALPAKMPVRLYGSSARTLQLGGRRVAIEALADAPPLGDGEWLLLHLAVLGVEPAALGEANDVILAQALRLAESGAVRRLVFASSGAVHEVGGAPDKAAYAEMKRRQEAAVRGWGARTGTPLLIPRIFNVGGPWITQPDRYALGSFVRQALAGGAIEIEARRRVVRSYVHVSELAHVILELALGGADGLAFDTAGTETVEIAELAAAVGRALGLEIEVLRGPLSPGEDRYVGDGAIYRETLARSGLAPIGLDRIVGDTADYLRPPTSPG